MMVYSSTLLWTLFQVLICGIQIKATPAPTSGDGISLSTLPPPSQPAQLCEPVCPGSFVPIGRQCFLVQHEKSDWYGARAKCSSLAGTNNGGDLAKPYDLRSLARLSRGGESEETKFWVGANDLATEGTWVWNNDAVINKNRWAPGQPGTDPEKNCVWMDVSKRPIVAPNILNTGICADKFGYVCQSNLIHRTTCY